MCVPKHAHVHKHMYMYIYIHMHTYLVQLKGRATKESESYHEQVWGDDESSAGVGGEVGKGWAVTAGPTPRA